MTIYLPHKQSRIEKRRRFVYVSGPISRKILHSKDAQCNTLALPGLPGAHFFPMPLEGVFT